MVVGGAAVVVGEVPGVAGAAVVVGGAATLVGAAVVVGGATEVVVVVVVVVVVGRASVTAGATIVALEEGADGRTVVPEVTCTTCVGAETAVGVDAGVSGLALTPPVCAFRPPV